MKFIKALVVCMVISLPFIYGYSTIKNGTWALAQKVTNLGQMPPEISESSGLEMADEPNTFFTHSDHGNSGATLYKINQSGKLLKTYSVSGASLVDWEDLTRDDSGNLYIADTGNNSGNRSELKIYKTTVSNPSSAQVITLSYDSRDAVESKGKKGKGKAKTAKNFNSEAIFWHNGNLYLVTKASGGNGEAHLFQVSDSPGSQTAKLIGSKELGAKITGADISPSGDKLVLMSVGKLHVFNISGSDYFKGNAQTINLGNVGQTEAMVFTDNNNIVFCNEGGQLFKYTF